ncbi:hypothetical protein [Streptodolium elevatio]
MADGDVHPPRRSRMTMRAYHRSADGTEVQLGPVREVVCHRDFVVLQPMPAAWPDCDCAECRVRA